MLRKLFDFCGALLTALALFSQSVAVNAEVEPRAVGVIIPLSGPMADWGHSIQLGIEFAAKQSTSKVQYIFEDEAACDAKKALSAAQKLIELDKVSLLLTGCLNGTLSVLPVAKKADVLVVSLGLVNDALAAQNRDSLITPSASITAEADGISQLLKVDGKKKLAVVRVEDNFTEEVMRGLKEYSLRDGWELVADERLTFDTTDFRPSLLKISRQQGADSVLIYSSSEQVVTAVRQLKELNITSVAPYAGYVIEADPPPANNMELLNGVRYAAAVTPFDDELSRYLASQKSKETFQTRVAADVVPDIATAIEACPNPSNRTNCFRNSLTARTKESLAFSGSFFYNEDGMAQRVVRGKVVRDGAFHWAGE